MPLYPGCIAQILATSSIALCMSCASHASQTHYLTINAPDLTILIAPPPAAGTPNAEADLRSVLALQRTRTPEQLAKASGDTHTSVFRFSDVLGKEFNEQALPDTTTFFEHLSQDGTGAVKRAKAHWRRPRPYTISSDVHPGIVTGRSSTSYPSGHATFAYLTAVILSAMVPEKRAEIFERAADYARGRVIGGVHFPSDIEAGRICGTVIAAALLQKTAFRSDLERATNETRRALGLAPLPRESDDAGEPMASH